MNRNGQDLVGGILLVFACHIGICLLMFFVIPFIGIMQFLYVVPITVYHRRHQRFELAKGVLIGAMITILLNGSCFGLLVASYIQSQPKSNDSDAWMALALIMAITIGLTGITFYAFNRRSRQK
jgi:hypothetical protein